MRTPFWNKPLLARIDRNPGVNQALLFVFVIGFFFAMIREYRAGNTLGAVECLLAIPVLGLYAYRERHWMFKRTDRQPNQRL